MSQNTTTADQQDNKTIQTILYIIKGSKNLNKYSLSKLLYYADALHFQKNQETITGRSYIHIEKSPLPHGINELLTYMVEQQMLIVRPAIHEGKVNGMVFDTVIPMDQKFLSSKELKTLRYITMLLGKKVDDESRIFPRLYEHYIITDLFTHIDFSKLPKDRPPKMKKKRKLVAMGDKIYKILFENN